MEFRICLCRNNPCDSSFACSGGSPHNKGAETSIGQAANGREKKVKGMRRQLERLSELEEEAKRGGGQKAIDKQHAQGKLTARERVDLFFDKGTFVELDMLAQHQCHDFGMEKTRPLGDAIITGYGNANGRLVFLYAYDFTVMGGSMGFTTVAKFCSLSRLARNR